MASGWRNDNYRHSLAARGIKTNFYAKKVGPIFPDAEMPVFNIEPRGALDTPVPRPSDNKSTTLIEKPFAFGRGQETSATIGTRIEGEGKLKDIGRKAVTEERSVNVALKQLNDGDPSEVIDLLKTKSRKEFTGNLLDNGEPEYKVVALSSGEVVALKTALAAKAMQYAQGGQNVPAEMLKVLDHSDATQISDILAMKKKATSDATKEALESPLSRTLKKDLSAIAGQVADAPGKGFEGVEFVGGSKLQGGPPGVVEEIEGLGKTNFVKVNDSIEPGKDQGMLNPLKFLPGGAPPQLGEGMNPVLARQVAGARRKAEIVQEQVDSLYDSKDDLAQVDLSAFEKGNEAFKKGNREQLIGAITDLTAEESKLRDRWALVGQTQRNVISIDNQTSAFKKPSDNNPLWGFGKSGGQQLADQTTKINKVREAILNANNKIFARKRMLQYRLQRLDSSVPPESSVPRKVHTFEKQEKSFMQSINNPVTESLNGEVLK